MNMRKLDMRVFVARQSSSRSRYRHDTRDGERQTQHRSRNSEGEKPQDGDDELLTPDGARISKSCVGKAIFSSHRRIGIQHSVNTISRSLRHPTMIAMRRLKKLTRYLLGTSEVHQELTPDQRAEALNVPVDSD